jgi:hypothetical protein
MTTEFQEYLRKYRKCFACWEPVNPASICAMCDKCMVDAKVSPDYVKPPPIQTRCVNCGGWYKDSPSENCYRCMMCNYGISKKPLIEEVSDVPALEPIPVAEKPKPRPKGPAVDIFASTYPRTIDAVFKTLIPKQTTMTFSLLQTLYAENSERFRVISGLHQNSFEDDLHLSLVVDCGRTSYTIHVYGFWKNYFHVHSVTMKESDDEIKTVAKF